MMKTLLWVFGLLLIVGGVYAGWRGYDVQDGPDGVRAQEMEITRRRSENTYRHRSQEEAEKFLEGPRQLMKRKQMEVYVYYGAAGVGLIAGFALLLLPAVLSPAARKPKAPAPEAAASAPMPEAPAQNQEAPRL
jgi:hypothetical protein